MESKYYLPKIEEFHIGFEYEKNSNGYDDKWHNEIIFAKFDDGVWKSNIDDVISTIEDGCDNYRVKYLDSSDIESLGFKKSNKDSWIGYKDYFLDSINPEYPYFLFATIHIPIRDDMYKILVHRYYNEDEPINEGDNYREPTCVYVGKIKNKSELSQLLKRLNIINE